ncbi:MAG TPA: hypothetical protein VFZ61_20240, partial [Polyangiales bacterium]
ELYNKQLKVDSSAKLPADPGGDNALYILDRSMISQQLERYPDSSNDLQSADKSIEMLDYSRTGAEEIGKYLFSSSSGQYKARPYEKLLINTENMINYLARGDLSGAKVEARRLAVMQKYLNETEKHPNAGFLGPGSYLAGFVFEMAGEYDEALRYYDEALRMAPFPTLDAAIQRASQYSGYRTPRLTEAANRAGASAADANTGEVLVVIGHGRVPALEAVRMNIGMAFSIGGLFMAPAYNQAARRMIGQGLVTYINFPALEKRTVNYAPPGIMIDQTRLAFDTSDLEGLVRAAVETEKPKVIASAIVRMVVRGGVGAGVGVGVAKASNNSGLGMLAAIVTQAAMVAADVPDTRSWATLPARLSFARLRVPAGRHNITVSAQGVTKQQAVDVPPGGFTVVNLTELSRR